MRVQLHSSTSVPTDGVVTRNESTSMFIQNPLKLFSNAIVTPVRTISTTLMQTFSRSKLKERKPSENLQKIASPSEDSLFDCSLYEGLKSPTNSSLTKSPVSMDIMAENSPEKPHKRRSILSQVRKKIGKIATTVSFRKKNRSLDSESGVIYYSPDQLATKLENIYVTNSCEG